MLRLRTREVSGGLTMVIDDGGAIWLADPWLAGAIIVLAMALVLWCHRWIETGRAPAPRSLGVQAVRMTRRRTRTRATPVRPTIVARSGRLLSRPARASSLPRSAA
jgi:hypothetical protein